MHILVIGSGGREHALVRALQRSPLAKRVECAPGNPGIAQDAPCLELISVAEIVSYCQKHKVDLVVVGPEQPLVDGLADRLRDSKIAVFGPSAKGAQLEASKDFTKKLCDKYNIPTAKYATFDNRTDAFEYIHKHGAPIVVKADGLASGKGVTVAMTTKQAVDAIDDCFDGAFGQSGAKVVIEEYLEGEEASFFALCDGTNAVMFASAQDHKRAFDNDMGPNTGGMGTYSPTPTMTPDMCERVMKEIIEPTVIGLIAEKISYVGVLFAGLMLTKDGPKLIEYNARFGDPETQVMLARFEGDLVALLMSCAQGKIDASQIRFSPSAAICVVMASNGYPAKFERNTPIRGLDRLTGDKAVSLLHAGTTRLGDEWVNNGGRVLNVVAVGHSLRNARNHAYNAIDLIDWPDGFYRRDIALRAL